MEFLFSYNTLIVLCGTSLLGASAGCLGTYLVLRRRALLGDALAHAAYPGIGIAFLLVGRSFAGLLAGAFVTALAGAWAVSAIRRHTRIKEDAAIGIVLSVFFGAGVAISRAIQNSVSSANKAGLDNYIYGQPAAMVRQDLIFISLVSLLILGLIVLLYKEFKLISFDSGLARTQGWPVLGLDMLMMALVCVTTIIGLPAVGVVLMAAMLIIPPAAARFWTDNFFRMMFLSAAFGLCTGLSGTLISLSVPNAPAGAVIILSGSCIFLFSMLAAPRRGIIARMARQARLRRRIADQNVLRTVFELSEHKWPEPHEVGLDAMLRLRAWTPAHARRLLNHCIGRGWVRQKGEGYALTESGWREAAEVVRTHRLWEIFLIEEAHVAPNYVDRAAERVEHVLPRSTVDRLEDRLRLLDLIPGPLRDVPPRHDRIAEEEEGLVRPC